MVYIDPPSFNNTGVDQAPARGMTILNSVVPVSGAGGSPLPAVLSHQIGQAYQSYGWSGTNYYAYHSLLTGGPSVKVLKSKFWISTNRLSALPRDGYIQLGFNSAIAGLYTKPFRISQLIDDADFASPDSPQTPVNGLVDIDGIPIDDDFGPLIASQWAIKLWNAVGTMSPYSVNGQGFRFRVAFEYEGI